MKSGTSSNSAEHRISLSHALADHRKLLLLTGAGISTDSGIPAYRDNHGDWKHSKPVQARDFYQSAAVRKRYWARSLNGWPLIAGAKPNRAHQLAAELEQSHRLQYTITQNVDGLHQRAGSNRVVDLHGNLSMVHCLSCGAQLSRAELQGHLITRNPYFVVSGSQPAPDGDAQFNADSEEFNVVDCQHCGGALKPHVV